MNAKFRLYLLNYLSTRRQRGFALPMVVMVGLVIAVVGATMVMQGMEDNNKVVSQKVKALANAAAETGMVRIQSFLTQYPEFATKSQDQWQTLMTTYTADANATAVTELAEDLRASSCGLASQSVTTVKTNTMSSLSPIVQSMANNYTENLPGAGNYKLRYRLKKYIYYPDGTAKVNVEGRVLSNNPNGADPTVARIDLVVSLPVASGTVTSAAPPVESNIFPGLWVKEYLQAGQNNNNPGTLDAQVVYDCSINAGNLTTTAGNGSSAGYTEYRSSNNAANGDKAIRVALPNGSSPPTPTNVPMPDPPSSTAAPVTPIALNSISSDLVLPRTNNNTVGGTISDTSNYDASTQTYYYTASSITGNGTDLRFIPGRKVIVYLTGNISIGGSSQITHNCAGVSGCDATNVRILGSATNTSGTFSTGGNSAVCSIFFWGPTYTVDMSGGGNAGDCPATYNGTEANQNGIYWVKAWIGGGQGSHQALNESGSSWANIFSIPGITGSFPVKNKIGSPTEYAMMDEDGALAAVPSPSSSSSSSISSSLSSSASSTASSSSSTASSSSSTASSTSSTASSSSSTPACSMTVTSASASPKKGSTGSITITYTNAVNNTISASVSGNATISTPSQTVNGNGSATFSIQYDSGNNKSGTISFSGCGSASTSFTTVN